MFLPSDPDMLYSIVNMKLRDQYDSLADLCADEDIDMPDLLLCLNKAGYDYDETHNRFIAR